MLSDELKYKDRIAKDPAVMVGQPVIRGTRIPVELVLDWLSEDLNLDELFAAYPRLTIEDVHAAIAFGRDAVRRDYLHSPERKEALAAARKRADRVPSKT
jgi:uncharacterized protein (DUF433 family)